jgi:predicted NUDIX family NTP pyrophosphohydrolase
LGTAKQRGGKIVTAWAIEANLDPNLVKSNTFTMEWPPKSGRMQDFQEIDKADWFTLDQARKKILKGQAPFLDRLADLLLGIELQRPPIR